MALDDRDVRERVARLESLLGALETLDPPAARAVATETVQAVVQLYGEGLARIMDHVMDAGSAALPTTFAEDELVSHLLLLHGLHPVAVEARVARALDEVRPYLESHGGAVELVGVEDGVAHLRLEGSCHGCPSSTQTLHLAIEEAIQRAAPDLERIEADGAAAPPATLVSLTTVRRGA